MKSLAVILLSIGLTGCLVEMIDNAPQPTIEVIYEPDLMVGGYNMGYYREGFGFWTGSGWDAQFYSKGHAGWGHYYRGAPKHAWNAYHRGPHYRGKKQSGRHYL